MAEDIVITEALEAARIAAELIPQYHAHLLDAAMVFWMTTQAVKCAPEKCNPAKRYMTSLHLPGNPRASVDAGADFIVWINRKEWDDLTTAQRKAYVDHRLMHAVRLEKLTNTGVEGKWGIQPHQFEDFPEILQRHGLYRVEAGTMWGVMQQLSLDLDAPPLGSSKTVTRSAGGESVTMTPAEFQVAGREHTRGEPWR